MENTKEAITCAACEGTGHTDDAQTINCEICDGDMKAVEEPVCEYPECGNCAGSCCDQCDRYFCSDHGTEGGDRQTQDVGSVAYPSRCWNCGGFNVDA